MASRTGPFRVTFDRRLNPATVHRGNVHIESGIAGALLSVRFDVVDMTIIAVPFYGGAIEPNVVHRLTIADVRDLDGAPLPEPRIVRFRTGAEAIPLEVPRPPAWSAVEPVLVRSCGGRGCHASAGAASGLVLDTAEGVRATAIGVASRQVPQAAGGEGARVETGLGGMRIIDVVAGVGRPATSYLMYKVLDDPHILGTAMPPRPVEPLSEDEVRLLDAWILAGAPTD